MKVHQTKIEPATKLSATNIIQVLSGTVAIVTWKMNRSGPHYVYSTLVQTSLLKIMFEVDLLYFGAPSVSHHNSTSSYKCTYLFL
jgi:hypothetical protein